MRAISSSPVYLAKTLVTTCPPGRSANGPKRATRVPHAFMGIQNKHGDPAPELESSIQPVSRRSVFNAGIIGACLVFKSGAAMSSDTVLYQGAAGEDTSVNCMVAKNKVKMGKMDLKSDNFTYDSTCRFGGYVVDVPYSLEVPDYLRPLSGFLNGGPDPTGQLDARLEDPETGTLVIVSAAGASPKNAKPWMDKSSIDEVGSMEEVLKSIGGNPKDVVESTTLQKAGETYFLWELNNKNSKYLNRRILAAAVRDGNMVLLVCVSSEKYWADTEQDLKAVAASFRLG